MKNFLFILIFTLCFFSYPVKAHENIENKEEKRTLSVSGEGSVLVAPNQVFIDLIAEKRGVDLLQTHKKNEESINALIAFLTEEQKIKKEHIQTNNITVEPAYKQCGFELIRLGKCDSQQIEYYIITKNIKIKLDDPEKFEKVIFKSLELGLSRIDNVEFLTTDFRKYRDEARALAMKAAQEKAISLVEPLGMKVLKPLEIKAEDSSSAPSWKKNRGANDFKEIGAPDIKGEGFGQINISATVQIKFEIE